MRIERIQDATLYLGDCRDILPTLGKVDAVVTDPPYGIDMHSGVRGGGYDGFGNGVKRKPRKYEGNWDKERPAADIFKQILEIADQHIIWGGNYFSDLLPMSQKWLFWDKLQTMPTFSDGEMAWTSLPGASTKKFTYNGSGLMAREKDRQHPTQKPIEVMRWSISFFKPDAVVLDPFMGSGTTGVACAKLGRQFIGIEIESKYFDIACRRIETAYKQPDMFIQRPEPAKQQPLF